MEEQARPRSGRDGYWLVIVLSLLAFMWLRPVFSTAKEAALESRRFDDGQRLARALRAYVQKHQGRLPGASWTSELERVDPGIETALWREVEGQTIGYGAVPGVLGGQLAELPDQTILFIETRTGRPNEIIHDLSQVGGRLGKGTAVAVTVENVRDDRSVSMIPLIKIGMQLQRQGAPNLK